MTTRPAFIAASLAASLLCPTLPTSAAPPAIKIGLAAPLTGADAGFGQGARLGAEQAVADINRAGGVGGQRLQLVVLDDAGDPKQGAAVAKKFVEGGVGLVVGHLNSGAGMAALPVYDEAGIVAVSPGATYPALTARGASTIFRVCGSDAQQGAMAGAWLAETFRGKAIAIVNDKTTFGRGLADEVARALKARGGREALFEGIARGERDLGGLAGRMRVARIDAVYFGGLAADGAALLRALHEAGYVGAFAGSDGLLDKDFPGLVGPGAEGTVMTLAPDPRRLPEARAADRKLPRPPETEMFTARAYAAVEVLKAGIEGAHTTEGRKVAEYLHSGRPLRTVIGEIAFDARGDLAKPPYGLAVWRRTPDGRLDYAGNTAGIDAQP